MTDLPANVYRVKQHDFRFLRGWWEVGRERIAFGCQDGEEAQRTGRRWFPYMKGVSCRKWYGNQDFVINWSVTVQGV